MIKLPVKLTEQTAWPFDLCLEDADGTEFHSEGRYAYSTRHKTLDDVMQAVGMDDDARIANERQKERLLHMVKCLNCHSILIAALDEIASHSWDDTAERIARSTLAKARGETHA